MSYICGGWIDCFTVHLFSLLYLWCHFCSLYIVSFSFFCFVAVVFSLKKILSGLSCNFLHVSVTKDLSETTQVSLNSETVQEKICRQVLLRNKNFSKHNVGLWIIGPSFSPLHYLSFSSLSQSFTHSDIFTIELN